MELLPSTDDQQWLLSILEDLATRRGSATLARPPLLPTNTDFPDAWTPNAAGIEGVLRRLLRHAGIGDRPIHLDVEHNDRPALRWPGELWHESSGAIGWFRGTGPDGGLHFGCRSEVVDDPIVTVAVLGHEVAHAYRRIHALEHQDQAHEERLTDATTVYLGFGVFTANASMRFTTGSLGATGHQWKSQWVGYLKTQDLCFLLAAQAAARNLGWWDRWRFGRSLTPNQRACFHASWSRIQQLTS